MGLLECAITGVALSMDAFAAAICQGLAMGKHRWRKALVVALFFGGFQALMPLLGWALGARFASQMEAVDHWIAFCLLGYLGTDMVRQSYQSDEPVPQTLAALGLLALATSVDAFAVGVSYAFLQVDIVPTVLLIGTITFALSLIGVLSGRFLGQHSRRKAQWTGGVLLCLLGVSILLEHLGH